MLTIQTDRRTLLGSALALGAAASTPVLAQNLPPRENDTAGLPLPDPTEVIDLWPGESVGMPTPPPVETVRENSTDPSYTRRGVQGITRPRMAVFRPRESNGAALVIFPGGAYRTVSIDGEGYDVARPLAEQGYTVFVCFYRLPYDGWDNRENVAHADAQRAVRLVRAHAAHYGIDPERVAIMGMSAGGHLVATLATGFARKVYAPLDAADALSAAPFCTACIYPVITMDERWTHRGSRRNLLGENPEEEAVRRQSPNLNIPADAAPFFLMHAEDDAAVPVENSLIMRDALKQAGVPVATHLFAKGGHGFGLRGVAGMPAAIWLDLWQDWAKSLGLPSTQAVALSSSQE